MRVSQACILVAFVSGIPAGAFAQSAQPVVKLPNEVEFKAPVSPGPQNAVLYGDPTKPGVYVQRTKLAPGVKVMPHWHPDEWRTAVVLSGTLLFRYRRTVGRKQAQGLSARHVLFRASEDAPLRVGEGR
jgi:quercetin dioxygenase-like cupin family protein